VAYYNVRSWAALLQQDAVSLSAKWRIWQDRSISRLLEKMEQKILTGKSL
jgi:hypothetical protein